MTDIDTGEGLTDVSTPDLGDASTTPTMEDPTSGDAGADQLYDVTVNGQSVQVTERELLDGYMRQGDYKTCKSCDRSLIKSRFSKDRSRGDGLQSLCKDCRKEQSRKWREENPEYRRAKGNFGEDIDRMVSAMAYLMRENS